MRKAAPTPATSDALKGFELLVPPTLNYRNASQFELALKQQAANTAVIEADPSVFARIDIDGRVFGTDWRLSKAAFGDLCNFAGVPSAFIRKLAVLDEVQALDVMTTLIRRVFHSGPPKAFVIDSTESRIDGIVGANTYSHIANQDALDYLLSAMPDLELSTGWLSGPDMRVTSISKLKPLEVAKGDIVHFGVNLENAIHGDRSLKVSEYVERLVCTNGAVATEVGHSTSVIHRGDVALHTQRAVMRAANNSESIKPALLHAPTHLMLPKEIESMRDWLANSTGGSVGLSTRVTVSAMEEATKENRPAEETTLWNWHNAITAVAKSASSVARQSELEAMGYKSLLKFGVSLN